MNSDNDICLNICASTCRQPRLANSQGLDRTIFRSRRRPIEGFRRVGGCGSRRRKLRARHAARRSAFDTVPARKGLLRKLPVLRRPDPKSAGPYESHIRLHRDQRASRCVMSVIAVHDVMVCDVLILYDKVYLVPLLNSLRPLLSVYACIRVCLYRAYDCVHACRHTGVWGVSATF